MADYESYVKLYSVTYISFYTFREFDWVSSCLVRFLGNGLSKSFMSILMVFVTGRAMVWHVRLALASKRDWGKRLLFSIALTSTYLGASTLSSRLSYTTQTLGKYFCSSSKRFVPGPLLFVPYEPGDVSPSSLSISPA